MEHSQIKAIQLLKESGYDGTPIVVLQITDRPFLDAAAVVTRQRLESVGFRVILKAMDWSTNLVVRARKTAPDKGAAGTCFSPGSMERTSSTPPSTSACLAQVRTPWFGWPNVSQLEKLGTDWVRTTDQAQRKQLADQFQKIALDEVTCVPWGGMGPANGIPKKRQGCSEVRSSIFLECEARVVNLI